MCCFVFHHIQRIKEEKKDERRRRELERKRLRDEERRKWRDDERRRRKDAEKMKKSDKPLEKDPVKEEPKIKVVGTGGQPTVAPRVRTLSKMVASFIK